MKKMLKKLKNQKGEVSVEWALVAVIMALIIVGVFNTGVTDGLNAAFTNINAKLSTGTM